MHDVTLDGRQKLVAETWNELSRPQLLRLMPVLYGRYADPNRQRIDALLILMGISLALGLRITPVQYVQIFWMTDFLLGDVVALTKQLLPRVRVRWGQPWYWGPNEGLSNVRFLEFVFADSYFIAYANSQDAQHLAHLVAVLYRPERRPYRPKAAGYGGDRREDFNENLVESRAQRLARLPEAEQLAILTWYRGCRADLEARYPLVFSPANEQTAAAGTGGWGQVLREMSGQAFGNFEETGRQHLHTVLAKMEDDLRRAQELERRAKQQQANY